MHDFFFYIFYRGASTYHTSAYFGQGSGTIWLDDFSCPPGAARINDCTGWTWGSHNCNPGEDAGVTCTPTDDNGGSYPQYSDVKMDAMASQITSLTIVYSTLYSGADQRKQSSASLAFVRGIHQWPVNSPHKGPVTRKMFPFYDVIMHSNRVGCRNIEYLHLISFLNIDMTQFVETLPRARQGPTSST